MQPFLGKYDDLYTTFSTWFKSKKWVRIFFVRYMLHKALYNLWEHNIFEAVKGCIGLYHQIVMWITMIMFVYWFCVYSLALNNYNKKHQRYSVFGLQNFFLTEYISWILHVLYIYNCCSRMMIQNCSSILLYYRVDNNILEVSCTLKSNKLLIISLYLVLKVKVWQIRFHKFIFYFY